MAWSSRFHFASPEETTAFAQRFAHHVQAGFVVLLEGDIGSGKTHFARSLIQSLLEQPEDVPSPTFTLVQTYDAPEFEIWHADLYRLSHPDEVFELGLIDAFDSAACLVEWPDRLADLAPNSALTLSFSVGENQGDRSIEARYSDAKWAFLKTDPACRDD